MDKLQFLVLIYSNSLRLSSQRTARHSVPVFWRFRHSVQSRPKGCSNYDLIRVFTDGAGGIVFGCMEALLTT